MSQHFYVTIQGIPLNFNLQFPFHESAGGADYYVLHGNIALADGSGLNAELSVHMSQVVKEHLNGLDAAATAQAAINSIRKTVDAKDMEFLKSSKKQPVHLSSRMFSIVQNKFTFHEANDEQIAEYLKQKAYWTHKIFSGPAVIADPIDLFYLGATADKVMEVARQLAAKGVIRIEGDRMSPENLNGAEIEGRTQDALKALQSKHEFERTVAHT
jgi:hypothetical protein